MICPCSIFDHGRPMRIRYTLRDLMIAVAVMGMLLGLAVNFPMLSIAMLMVGIMGGIIISGFF